MSEKKCVYCDEKNGDELKNCIKKATHFICGRCGCGMCEDCYNQDKEHIYHYYEFDEILEDDKFYDFIVKTTNIHNGYMCDGCLNDLRVQFENTKKIRGKEMKEYKEEIIIEEIETLLKGGVIDFLDIDEYKIRIKIKGNNEYYKEMVKKYIKECDSTDFYDIFDDVRARHNNKMLGLEK